MNKMEFTFCCGLPEDDVQARELLAFYQQVGVTSVQSYIQWKRIEPVPGQFVWDYYDREVRLLKAYGLRWVPFIILGPWYITPEWFQNSAESHFARCLEHGRASRVQSIWNPHLMAQVDRVMGALAAHYLPQDILESVLLGISGDYGEAIYQAVGNWPRDYHTHAGYWCGDSYAAQAYRQWLSAEFGTLEALNQRWNSHYPSWDITPFLARSAPSTRAWLDQLRWYRQSMITWADGWFATAKKNFPAVPIYLCTGGDGTPAHGSDFSLQCKLAARHAGGVRITNEGSDYLFNFIITRLVGSASRHYGAFFGYEPASRVDTHGITARIYNATASGARQLHEYSHNLHNGATYNSGFKANLERYHALLTPQQPIVEVAVLLPLSDFATQEIGFSSRMVDSARRLRPVTDFDFVDENMLCDGALQHYRYLIVLDGQLVETEALRAVEAWVKAGGVLISFQMLQDVSGDSSLSRRMFGLTEASDRLVAVQSVRIGAPEWLEQFGRAEQLITAHSYSGLAPTARFGAETESGDAVVWVNRHGEGAGVFYAGPREMDPDLSFAWMGAQHMYFRLIEDCLHRLHTIEARWKPVADPAAPQEGVYATQTKTQWLYLNTTPDPVERVTPAGVQTLPPHSISQIGSGA